MDLMKFINKLFGERPSEKAARSEGIKKDNARNVAAAKSYEANKGAIAPVPQFTPEGRTYSVGADGSMTAMADPFASAATSMQSFAQRDFPGRTNYGVPEDNMIDTPQGYITPQQYNQLAPYDREAITQGLGSPRQPQAPYASPITGANNPIRQVQRNGIAYSPGEGPRTNFRR